MWSDPLEMAQETNSLLDECLKLRFFTVGKELQTEAAEQLDELAGRIDAFRRHAQERTDECAANTAYAFMEYVFGTAAFLRMWVKLKEDDLDGAWGSLVRAQRLVECGLRLLPNEEFAKVNRLLHNLEHVLFPPQIFVSSALQYEWAKCNICGGVYGDCDHIAGRLYSGEMCSAIVQEVGHIDHVALVLDPADKTCRAPTWSVDDKMRCMFTRRVVKSDDGAIERVPILRGDGDGDL